MDKIYIKEQTRQCIEWIRMWFSYKSGGAKGVILGISGGKDSSVVAALLCRAIGKERVFGLLLPDGIQPDLKDALDVCKLLSIQNHVIDIHPIMQAIQEAATRSSQLEDTSIYLTEQAKINIPPRIRMTILYAVGQSLGYRVAGTGNLSERYVGYCTKWGDMACDFNPIAHFTKEEVVAIGDELGLPDYLIHKPPSDGLTGKTDEENMGITYDAISRYLAGRTCTESECRRVELLHHHSLHKLLPAEAYQPQKL